MKLGHRRRRAIIDHTTEQAALGSGSGPPGVFPLRRRGSSAMIRRLPVDHHTGDRIDQHAGYEANQEATTAAVSPAARSQLEAIRDEWLQPLVNQLREAERSIGRLEQERDQFRGEIERLHAERNAPPVQPALTPAAPRPWWERLLGLTRR